MEHNNISAEKNSMNKNFSITICSLIGLFFNIQAMEKKGPITLHLNKFVGYDVIVAQQDKTFVAAPVRYYIWNLIQVGKFCNLLNPETPVEQQLQKAILVSLGRLYGLSDPCIRSGFKDPFLCS